jgi:hypothetical protein
MAVGVMAAKAFIIMVMVLIIYVREIKQTKLQIVAHMITIVGLQNIKRF